MSDGKLKVPMSTDTVSIRFDASGSKDDDWKLQNLQATLQAADTTAPTIVKAVVSPGPYTRGSQVTVTLVFSEPVNATVYGNNLARLDTSWGENPGALTSLSSTVGTE